MFFWNKDVKDIVRKERADERYEADCFYMNELKNIRAKHMRVMNELEQEFNKKLKDELYKKDSEILKLRQQVVSTQKAWTYIKEYLPDYVKFANMAKIKSKIELDSSVNNYSQISKLDDGLESLQRKLNKISPSIEKLLGDQ